jgi:hypothetical protein
VTIAPAKPSDPSGLPISAPTIQRIRELLKPDFSRAARSGPSTPTATAIPKNPDDGDTFRYSTGSVDWYFRYDAASGYWKFAGGSELESTGGSFTSTLTGTYELVTTGPNITVPFAGEYRVYVSALGANPSGTSIIIGVVLFVGVSGVGAPNGVGAIVSNGQATIPARDVVTLAAGDVLRLGVYGYAVSGPTSWGLLRLAVVPVRIH